MYDIITKTSVKKHQQDDFESFDVYASSDTHYTGIWPAFICGFPVTHNTERTRAETQKEAEAYAQEIIGLKMHGIIGNQAEII
jgi:hypothetical protein